MATMTEFTGSKLTHGAFVQMNQEVRTLIIQATSAALKLEDELPAYSAAVDRMDKLVKRLSGYEETTDVTAADQMRDNLWLALYYAHHYLAKLPATSKFYAPAKKLAPVFSAYKDMHRHELMKETTEITGFIDQLAKDDNMAAVKTLGFTAMLTDLQTANDAILAANAARSATAATRAVETGKESTDEVRKQVISAYRTVVARVNAAGQFFASDVITKFMADANTVAAHYQIVSANQAKKSKKVNNA